MKVTARGQITIPKEIRDQFGIGPGTAVEFEVISGAVTLKRTPTKIDFAKWRGYCADSLKELGYSSADEFIEDIRGR